MAIYLALIDVLEILGFTAFILGIVILGGSEYQVDALMEFKQISLGLMFILLALDLIAIGVLMERAYKKWTKKL